MFRMLIGVLAGLVVTAASAAAATFVAPAAPLRVPLDAHHYPKAVTISVQGYKPGSLLYVEQCDGTSPLAPQWSPTYNCDIASSPSAALAGANGVATFSASDSSLAFVPFVGEGPSRLFNCIASGDAAPQDAVKTFTNCQVRVSTNDADVTSDQIFMPLVLPVGAKQPPPPPDVTTLPRGSAAPTTVKKSSTHPGAAASGTHSSTTSTPHRKLAPGTAKIVSNENVNVALHPKSSSHHSSSSSPAGPIGAILLVAGVGVAIFVAMRARNTRRVAGSAARERG
jgi:hypothetical protein